MSRSHTARQKTSKHEDRSESVGKRSLPFWTVGETLGPNLTPDPYGNKAMAASLEGYERITREDACKRGPVDLKRVTVWTKRGGKWERRRAVDVLGRKPRQSICRALVTALYGWTNAQYEEVRDAFDDVFSNDVMGIYANLDGDYAVVGRLPASNSKTALASAAVGGALTGLAAKWGYDKMQNENIAWYRQYLLKAHRLRDALFSEETEANQPREEILANVRRLQFDPVVVNEVQDKNLRESHTLSEALKILLMVFGFSIDRFESIDTPDVHLKADAMSMVIGSYNVVNTVIPLILDQLNGQRPTAQSFGYLNTLLDSLPIHGMKLFVQELKVNLRDGILKLTPSISPRMQKVIDEFARDFQPPV
jgi:hypothetical protein